MKESDFIALLKKMPLHEGARGLNDDAATIAIGGQNLIFTKDVMVEGVHYFPDANPCDVAWKLLAVNLSDLAAKGAKPIGVMLGYTLGDDVWDKAFAVGFQDALDHYDVKLLGGDTVSSDRPILSLTAIGVSNNHVPSRSGAKIGDILYVSGPLGDAYAGYEMIKAKDYNEDHPCVKLYNRPVAQLLLGQKIAPHVNAMMDISDGLLIDAQHMARASNSGLEITLDTIPLSDEYIQQYGMGLDAIITASTWGDDYQLLCAAHQPITGCAKVPSAMTRIGHFTADLEFRLSYKGKPVASPLKLGFEHNI